MNRWLRRGRRIAAVGQGSATHEGIEALRLALGSAATAVFKATAARRAGLGQDTPRHQLTGQVASCNGRAP